MRRWSSSPALERYCGLCGRLIPKGTEYQEVHIEGLKGHLVRCLGCAQGKPPQPTEAN